MEEIGRWLRGHWHLLLAGALSLFVLALLVLAAFPWGMFDRTIAERLSRALDRPVTIAAIERTDVFSLHPTVAIRGLAIPQPGWAEADGPLIELNEARIGFSALSLLWGSPKIEHVRLSGLRARLIRDAEGRTNWSGGGNGDGGGGGPRFDRLRQLSVDDVRIDYRDAVQNRSFALAVVGSAERGLRISGTGEVHGAPVTLDARGAPFAARAEDGRWPFALRIAGDAITLDFRGTAARPLAFESLAARVRARANDLALLDALIEAGLPGTQPVRLDAQVRHEGPDWFIDSISGTVGRSDLSGEASVRKRGGRTRIEGTLRARRFDFDDLASDAGRAEAAAKTARLGKRVVPDTAIDLDTLGPTDGVLRIHADRLLWPGSKPFRSLDATIRLEGKHLTVSPLVFGMPHGTLSGEASVVQEAAGPRLTLRLALENGRLADLFPGAGFDAPARGRIDLTGIGTTVRAAIGTASGDFALVARDGTIPERTAILLGQDIGRAIGASDRRRARLRCIAARFVLNGGTATARDVRIDTSRALTGARGTVRFPGETLALALEGAPKQKNRLRIEGPVPVHGTIKAPRVETPESADSLGDWISQVGEAIFGGGENSVANDLDCGRAIARAMDF